MMFDVEVKISLKSGLLNPEATTIKRLIELRDYNVKNIKTFDTIKFQIEGDEREAVRLDVINLCERLFCNPEIHVLKVTVIPIDTACGVGQ